MRLRLSARLLRLGMERPGKLPAYLRIGAGLHLVDLLGRRSPAIRRRRRLDRIPPPLVVTAKLTDRCDLRCPACFQWGEVGRYRTAPSRKERDTGFWLELVDRCSSFRPFLYFYGGEPLLREDLPELAVRATSRGLPSGVNTNGQRLARMAPELVQSGLDVVMVSLDGREEEHDAARGDGTFRRAAAGIETLLAERKSLGSAGPLVSVVTLVTRQNHRSLPALARLIDAWRPDLWTIQLPVFTSPGLLAEGRRQYQADLGTEPSHWQGYLAEYDDWDLHALKQGVEEIEAADWSFTLRRHPAGGPEFDWVGYFHRPEDPLGRHRCIYPWTHTQIMPDGDVAVCADAPDCIVGNVTDRDLLELWAGDRYRTFRQALLRRGQYPFCSRCWGLGAVRPRGRRG